MEILGSSEVQRATVWRKNAHDRFCRVVLCLHGSQLNFNVDGRKRSQMRNFSCSGDLFPLVSNTSTTACENQAEVKHVHISFHINHHQFISLVLFFSLSTSALIGPMRKCSHNCSRTL